MGTLPASNAQLAGTPRSPRSPVAFGVATVPSLVASHQWLLMGERSRAVHVSATPTHAGPRRPSVSAARTCDSDLRWKRVFEGVFEDIERRTL